MWAPQRLAAGLRQPRLCSHPEELCSAGGAVMISHPTTTAGRCGDGQLPRSHSRSPAATGARPGAAAKACAAAAGAPAVPASLHTDSSQLGFRRRGQVLGRPAAAVVATRATADRPQGGGGQGATPVDKGPSNSVAHPCDSPSRGCPRCSPCPLPQGPAPPVGIHRHAARLAMWGWPCGARIQTSPTGTLWCSEGVVSCWGGGMQRRHMLPARARTCHLKRTRGSSAHTPQGVPSRRGPGSVLEEGGNSM